MFNPLSLQGPVDVNFKFSDGDGPNLCRIKKIDVSSTFFDVSQGTLNVNSVPVKALSDLENKKRHPCFFKNRFLVKVNLL